MASRRLIKGIRSLAPKAFKTTKLSPVILPRGVIMVVTDFIAEDIIHGKWDKFFYEIDRIADKKQYYRKDSPEDKKRYF